MLRYEAYTTAIEKRYTIHEWRSAPGIGYEQNKKTNVLFRVIVGQQQKKKERKTLKIIVWPIQYRVHVHYTKTAY